MTDKCFIDTNIWIYAHLKQSINQKHSLALNLIENLQYLIISTQVLNEYYSVMLKKKIPDSIIQDNIEVIIDIAEIYLVEVNTIRLAHRLKLKYGFSYWDSLILASALNANCQIIYTEDLQHKQVIENRLKVLNPFIDFC